MTLKRWIEATFYSDVRRKWDDCLLRERVLGVLTPESVLLDIGAGAGIVAEMDFKPHAARVCGVDPDARVVDNPHLHEGRVGVGEALPYPDRAFSVVVADNVLEHLDDPEAVLREVARVLEPGGRFLAKTPNKHHYMPWIARATSHRFHEWINRRRGRAEVDTFPTRYRANSKRDVRRHAESAGLELVGVSFHEERPEYARVFGVTYLAGLVWERAVNHVPGLAGLRSVMIVELRRPVEPVRDSLPNAPDGARLEPMAPLPTERGRQVA